MRDFRSTDTQNSHLRLFGSGLAVTSTNKAEGETFPLLLSLWHHWVPVGTIELGHNTLMISLSLPNWTWEWKPRLTSRLSSSPNTRNARSSVLRLLLLSRFSCVRLCATPETAAHQASPSLGFSRQEHWSGLPFPSPMHESEKWKWSRSVVSDS